MAHTKRYIGPPVDPYHDTGPHPANRSKIRAGDPVAVRGKPYFDTQAGKEMIYVARMGGYASPVATDDLEDI